MSDEFWGALAIAVGMVIIVGGSFIMYEGIQLIRNAIL